MTSNRGGRGYLPYALTEQGVAMLSGVLRSRRAVHVNIAIMRAFVKLQEMLASHRDLARKLAAMGKKYDCQFVAPIPHGGTGIFLLSQPADLKVSATASAQLCSADL